MNAITWLITEGNLADGFTQYGPFNDAESACEWAVDNLQDASWVCSKCYSPEPHQ